MGTGEGAALALQSLNTLLHFAPTAPRNICRCALGLQVWLHSLDGQEWSLLLQALEQAGVVRISHTTTWQAHAGNSTQSRRFHPDPELAAPPGELPRISRALVCSCLKAVSSFAGLGMQDEEGSRLPCLLHTSGTDMEPILQTAARAPLPLEDFSKTRLPTADLQRFLEQRGDSREATNYVDEEPDSKQCLFSL